MNFNILFFEQTINEPLLKGGWRLINSIKIPFEIQKNGFQFQFIWKQAEVNFIKKGNLLSHVKCSCSHPLPCKHVSAILFYFKNLNTPDAISLFKGHARRIYLNSDYLNFKTQLNSLLKEVALKNEKTKTKNDSTHLKALEDYINTESSGYKVFYFDLALITLFDKISKTTGNYFQLQHQASIERITKKLNTKINSKQLHALQEVTFESVKHNLALQSGAFTYLVPWFLRTNLSTLTLIHLQNNLTKLSYKQKYNQVYNPLRMLQFLVAFKLEQEENIAEHEVMLEWWIAKAEYILDQGKQQQALKFLHRAVLQFQTLKSPLYFPLLNYSFSKSKELDNKSMQLYFGQLLLVNSSIFLEPIFHHILELVPRKRHLIFLENILEKMKFSTQNNIEKKYPILLRLSKYGELLSLLKLEKQRFNLIHELAMNLLPNFNKDVTATYLNHLVNSCVDSKPFVYQQKIVKLSLDYFSQLPLQIATELKSEALYRIGKNKPIYHFAQKLWLSEYS